VLDAVARLDRRRFVPEAWRDEASVRLELSPRENEASVWPWLTAWMTELLRLGGDEKVLEVGTGSGFQAALLAHLAGEVWSVEVIPALAAAARHLLLDELRLSNVHLAVGENACGPDTLTRADYVVVTAAAPAVPPALVAQLWWLGGMILPLGPPEGPQVLHLVDLDWEARRRDRDLVPVRFVPLVEGRDGCRPGPFRGAGPRPSASSAERYSPGPPRPRRPPPAPSGRPTS